MNRKGNSALALVALVVLSAVVGTAGAAMAGGQGNSAINYDADQAPNPYIAEDYVTIAEHNQSAMDSPLAYYDDNGDVQTLPAKLNSSVDNPIGLVPTEIDDPMFNEYPRKGDADEASVLDASEWTTSGASMDVTDADGTPAEGVPAVSIATDGSLSDGNTASATYANQSITTDAEKRVPTVFADVETLEAGANAELRFVDSDGDYKAAVINSSLDASDDDVVANATGEGYVWQERLANLATEGDGDGTFDGIEEINVSVADGDAELVVTALDAEHKSELVLGERLEDTDDDEDLETVTIRERHEPGAMRLSGVDTLGDWASDASLQNVRVHGVQYQASLVASEDASAEFGSADSYPGFDSVLTYNYRLEVPSAIDLTHHGLALEAEQAFLQSRYNAFKYIEGAGDTDFADLDNWTDKSTVLGERGSTATVDDTVQADVVYAGEVTAKLQSDQTSALQDTSGGVVGAPGSSGGGFSLGGLLTNPVAVFSGLVGALWGIPKAIGRWVNR